jgi:hypothetical protein
MLGEFVVEVESSVGLYLLSSERQQYSTVERYLSANSSHS